jgi:hypothetical protein
LPLPTTLQRGHFQFLWRQIYVAVELDY